MHVDVLNNYRNILTIRKLFATTSSSVIEKMFLRKYLLSPVTFHFIAFSVKIFGNTVEFESKNLIRYKNMVAWNGKTFWKKC